MKELQHLKPDERIAALEAELEQDRQKKRKITKSVDSGNDLVWRDLHMIRHLMLSTQDLPPVHFFLSFYECIEPTARNMQSMYYQASDTISLSGRKKMHAAD